MIRSGNCKPVSDAGFRQQMPGFGWVDFDLGTQLAHVEAQVLFQQLTIFKPNPSGNKRHIGVIGFDDLLAGLPPVGATIVLTLVDTIGVMSSGGDLTI